VLKSPNKRGCNVHQNCECHRVLICALVLIIGSSAGKTALAEQSANTKSLGNFREDYPLKEYRGKTYKNETVQIDGNNFIECTFDNVTFRFDGEAPFRFTNDHFTGKFSLTSNNPVVKATMALISNFIKLENAAQNQSKENNLNQNK
jgi:hypothetical protein